MWAKMSREVEEQQEGVKSTRARCGKLSKRNQHEPAEIPISRLDSCFGTRAALYLGLSADLDRISLFCSLGERRAC